MQALEERPQQEEAPGTKEPAALAHLRKLCSPTILAEMPPGRAYLLGVGASWCAPWRLLVPQLQELCDAGLLSLLDSDASPAAATYLRVVVLPTFILLVDGQECRRWVGAVTPQQLREGVVKGRPRRGGIRA